MAQHLAEQQPRLIVPSFEMERLDQPEGADVESGLWPAKVVLVGIAQHVLAAAQLRFDRRERSLEPRVARTDEAHLGELQQAGVEVIASEAGLVMAAAAVFDPCLEFDFRPDGLRPLGPQFAPCAIAQLFGDVGQPVARRPTHHRRIGVDLLPRAEFP